MKREELKKLGLTDEQIEKVMAAHGQSINPLNTQIATLQKSEKELQEQIKKHESDLDKIKKENSGNEELQKKIEQLETENKEKATEYQQSLVKVQRDSALNLLLANSKAKNPKAVAALLDDEKIVFKDGELSGAKEQLEALQKSDKYLFDMGKQAKAKDPVGGKTVSNYGSFEEAMEADDLETYFEQQEELGGNE